MDRGRNQPSKWEQFLCLHDGRSKYIRFLWNDRNFHYYSKNPNCGRRGHRWWILSVQSIHIFISHTQPWLSFFPLAGFRGRRTPESKYPNFHHFRRNNGRFLYYQLLWSYFGPNARGTRFRFRHIWSWIHPYHHRHPQQRLFFYRMDRRRGDRSKCFHDHREHDWSTHPFCFLFH